MQNDDDPLPPEDDDGRLFVQIPGSFFDQSELPEGFTVGLLFFYMGLLSRLRPTRTWFRAPIAGLAANGRCSVSSAKTYLERLRSKGWVQIEHLATHDWLKYTVTGPTAVIEPQYVQVPGTWFPRDDAPKDPNPDPPGLLFLYAAVLLHTHAGLRPWHATVQKVAASGRCATNTGDKYVRALEERLWLRVERRSGRSGNTYWAIGPSFPPYR